jgi:polysaccharide export outer membrane protein
MIFKIRRVLDWLGPKPFVLMVSLFIGSLQAAYCQANYGTPQEANDKIQQLATLARTHPVDTPIGSGDLLHIDVFDVPELSRDVRVSDAGDISYPLVPGKISVTGRTSFEVESKLEQLLIENGLVSHPHVSVFVKEMNSAPVTVVGAVNHTLVFQVVRPTSLLEVLSAAGGISDTAGDVVIVTRVARSGVAKIQPTSTTTDSTADQQKITIRLQDLLASGDSVFNIPIYGGDTVTVPPAGIVYVLGFGISQPGGYVLQSHGEQITVLKAVALAHGLQTFAKADSSVIMRMNTVTGQRDAIPVQIKKIENHKMNDVPLESNDILYVPDNKGMKVLARGAEAALSVGSGIATYRVP